MPEMDQGIKRLIEGHPQDLLTFAVPGATYLETLSGELAMLPQLEPDVLLRVRYQEQECAVHVEAEARPRKAMAQRCFDYGARIWQTTGLPVLSVVLWLQAGGTPPASPFELRAGNRLVATWHFTGIELYALDAEQLLSSGLLGLLPLVPFTKQGGDEATIERTALLVKEQAPAAEIEVLETLLAVFGARTIGADAIRTLMRRLFMSTEILETSPLYQEWVARGKAEGLAEGLAEGKAEGLAEGLAEGKAEGLAEGLAEGKAEGLAEGLAEGKAEAVLTVLRVRFGTLPPAVEAAIRAATLSVLDEVLEHAISDSLEQLSARLGV